MRVSDQIVNDGYEFDRKKMYKLGFFMSALVLLFVVFFVALVVVFLFGLLFLFLAIVIGIWGLVCPQTPPLTEWTSIFLSVFV